MQYNLPKRINSEADLKHYEKYLLADSKPMQEIINTCTLEEYLKSQIGKYVNVQCFQCNRIGVILEIGKDFLVIRRSNNNTLIPFHQIKSIILPQGN